MVVLLAIVVGCNGTKLEKSEDCEFEQEQNRFYCTYPIPF